MEQVLNFLLIGIFAVSCSSEKEKIHLSPFEIKMGNSGASMAVNKSGEIMIAGETVGRIQTDGTIFDKDGKVVAQFTDSSFLKSSKGRTVAKIDKKGNVEMGSGVLMNWSEKGVFQQGGQETGMTVAPADESLFQAASIVLMLYFTGEAVDYVQ